MMENYDGMAAAQVANGKPGKLRPTLGFPSLRYRFYLNYVIIRRVI